MHATYKNALMWTLYGVLFLLIAVLQTVVFGRARFFGVKLTLIPVCIACVSMLAGAEAGALYGLCCGTVWCFTGAAGGASRRSWSIRCSFPSSIPACRAPTSCSWASASRCTILTM